MISLSVNVNKVATVRNSRGGRAPDPVEAALACVEAGAAGITVHPREDGRHIRREDVFALARALADVRPGVELNVEGDPRPDWLSLVYEVRPEQATLVPVLPGELTSQAGWPPDTDEAEMSALVADLKARGIRVSVFIEPDVVAVDWAARVGADRVELYTEPFARAFAQGEGHGWAAFEPYVRAARHAHAVGLGINAGHDLDLANLTLFRALPHLDEVSIGHALISRALFDGLAPTVRAYLQVLGTREPAPKP